MGVGVGRRCQSQEWQQSGLNRRGREGAEGGWAHIPCPNDGCPPGFAMLSLPARFFPLPDPGQLQTTPPPPARQLTGTIGTEEKSDFNALFLGAWTLTMKGPSLPIPP